MASAPTRVISMPVTRVITVEPTRAQNTLRKILFFGTVGLLMFGPLAFGGTEPWAVFVLQTGATALFLTWAISQALAGTVRLNWSPIFLPMLLFAGVIGLQLLLGTTVYR